MIASVSVIWMITFTIHLDIDSDTTFFRATFMDTIQKDLFVLCLCTFKSYSICGIINPNN